MVESTLNYLATMSERPVYYLCEPPPGKTWRNTKGNRQTRRIENAREVAKDSHLDREGFALARIETSVADLYDAGAVRERYYPEVEELVRRETGAGRVVAFDHNVRSAVKALRGEDASQHPVRFVHNDYTLDSGPQRVRDLLGDEAEGLLEHRFAVINVWKPIRGPVREAPLAVCDAGSLRQEDFVETDLVYPGRTGEVYSVLFREEHRWFYYPEMRADEAMLLKCYDSEADRARFTAHTAFDDPTSPPDAPRRESIEVRTLAFFAPS